MHSQIIKNKFAIIDKLKAIFTWIEGDYGYLLRLIIITILFARDKADISGHGLPWRECGLPTLFH